MGGYKWRLDPPHRTNVCKIWLLYGAISLLTFNPLSPSIHIQLLQTDLHTFPYRMSLENLIKDQGIFSWVITLLILIIYLLTVYGYC